MKRSKKGIVEIQLNWIYVAVVGAIILALFVSIAVNIKKSATTRLESDAMSYFDEIFTSIQGSENTEHSINLPGVDIEVDSAKTGSDQCNFYRIGKTAQGKDIQYIPVFSPGLIKRSVLSYSLGWDAPFRASYFLFLSSPEIAYVFVKSPATKSMPSGTGSSGISMARPTGPLIDVLPKHLVKQETDDPSAFVSENYYKVKYVMINTEPSFSVGTSVARINDDDVTALNIIPGGELLDGGKLEFYVKKGSSFEKKGESYYLDKPTLFAAIYSESLESYECNMAKALSRENKVIGILMDRAEAIKSSDLLPACTTEYYNGAKAFLASLEGDTKEGQITKSKLDSMKKTIIGLNKLNRDINNNRCPTIY